MDYLRRIRAFDGQIGAFRFVDEANVIEDARQVDRRRKSSDQRLGALMGIPIAIREIFKVEGLPFGAGTDADISDLAPAEGKLSSKR